MHRVKSMDFMITHIFKKGYHCAAMLYLGLSSQYYIG